MFFTKFMNGLALVELFRRMYNLTMEDPKVFGENPSLNMLLILSKFSIAES